MTAAPMVPLAGITVLDLSRYLPGPLLTQILAQLGARVIKVESPQGDPTRYMPPILEGHAAAFTGLNAGKPSIALNLKAPAGKAVFEAMVNSADVLVETNRPGVLERLGLGYASLSQINPAVILCSISGYGQTGPLRERAGHDLNYIARAGVLGLSGPPGGPPQLPAVQIADVGGGALSGAVAVLAALMERNATGKGRHLDISMTRGATAFLSLEAPRQVESPEAPGDGMLTGGLPCYRVYATADGRSMALGALEPKFFQAFCERAGVGHLAADGFARGERGQQVTAELEALFRGKTQREWVALLDGCDCCCEPVRTPEEALADPELGLSLPVVAGAPVLRAELGAPGAAVEARVSAVGQDGPRVCAELGVPPQLVDAAIQAGAMLPGE